jgi:hypothetical protein
MFAFSPFASAHRGHRCVRLARQLDHLKKSYREAMTVAKSVQIDAPVI